MDNDLYQDVSFPLRGLERAHGFGMQPEGTTTSASNVRAFDPSSGRARGGSRPGLGKFISSRLPPGDHLVQHLNVVAWVSPQANLDTPESDYSGPDVVYDPSTPGPWPGPNGTDGGDRPRDGGDPGRGVPPGGTGRVPSWNRLRVPLIIWPDPAPVAYGTPLSGTQLNAYAVDPVTFAVLGGEFDYSPPAGEVLPVGTHVLQVVFFPEASISNDYTTASAEATLVVLAGPPADDMLFWYIAGTECFQDTACLIEAVSDGDQIAVWKDQSGHAHHLSNADPTKLVNLQLNELNDLPVVRCPAASLRNWQTIDSIEWPVNLSFYVVAKAIGVNGLNVILASTPFVQGTSLFQLNSNVGANGIVCRQWVGAASFADNAPSPTEPPTFGLQEWLLWDAVCRTTEVEAYMNGASDGATAVVGTPNTATQTLSVVSDGPGSLVGIITAFVGDIAEIIGYGRAHDTTEQAQTRLYLNAKYELY